MGDRPKSAPVLGPRDRRQLRLFAWFLFIVDLCILGIGLLFQPTLDFPADAWLLIAAVAVLVNSAFLAIVGGNVLVVYLEYWRRGPSRTPPE